MGASKTKTGCGWVAGLTMLVLTLSPRVLAKYSGGTGTVEDPYRITTKEDLLALAADTNDYAAHFVLTGDIDLSGHSFTTALIGPDINPWGPFVFDGTAFTGTFDGKGHKIIGLTIDTAGASNHFLGLFGCIGQGGQVRDLGMEDVRIVSGNESECVGGLVGQIGEEDEGQDDEGEGDERVTTKNCYVTGSVTGGELVGGLVGLNGSTIIRCYSTASVWGQNDTVGGLVGYNASSIAGSYFTGSLSGRNWSWDIGGLVGENRGTITDCYATGSVTGGHQIGGLVGCHTEGEITNCYAISRVTGGGNSEELSGLVGENDGTVEDVVTSFWDVETSGQTTSDGGVGKTTAEMKQRSTFPDWDFVEIWDIAENQTYPFLRFTPAGDLNYDTRVDLTDFAILAMDWLQER